MRGMSASRLERWASRLGRWDQASAALDRPAAGRGAPPHLAGRLVKRA